jgi:hypothetical protein
MQRGIIRKRDAARQIRDFSGMRFGTITPTDIDGLIEYHGKAYVIIETKFGDTDVPIGQFKALERMCDDLQKVKPTLFIIARHNCPPEQDIDFSKCIVEKYRWRGEWVVIKNKTQAIWTTRQVVLIFLKNQGYIEQLPPGAREGIHNTTSANLPAGATDRNTGAERRTQIRPETLTTSEGHASKHNGDWP